MKAAKAPARPQHARNALLLRQLQKSVALAKCIRIAANYPDDDLDIADAIAGLVIVLGATTATLDRPGGAP